MGPRNSIGDECTQRQKLSALHCSGEKLFFLGGAPTARRQGSGDSLSAGLQRELQALAVFVCFSIRARAVSRSLRPSKPRLFMSSAHSTSIERERRRNSWASAGLTVKML